LPWRTEALLFRDGMSILTDSARWVVYRDGEIIVSMQSGAEIRFPVAENPRLARGTKPVLLRALKDEEPKDAQRAVEAIAYINR
jgi:hypothetical protein